MSRLLFIGPNRIGDGVLATAALDYAMSLLPNPRVTVAIGPLPAPLYRAVPGLERLIEVRKVKSRYGAHWLRLLRDLAGEPFQLAVDLRGTLITALLPVKRRIVYRKTPLVRHKLVELAALMGSPDPLTPRIRLDDRAREAAREALGGAGPLILALGAGSNVAGKRWAQDRFAALARRLVSPAGAMAGGRVVLLGGPEDVQVGREMAYSLAGDGLSAIDLTGRLDLPACAAVLERATLFVGNDSGLMHMAGAMGAPTLGLFGPSDERVYGPTGAHARAVRGRSYEELMAGVRPADMLHPLMDDLSVDAVERAAIDLLSTGGLT